MPKPITYEYVRTDHGEPIVMTVALPVKKMDKIIWLALESLRRQKEVNFGWELIVFEDQGSSLDIIKSFAGKLPGCQRIFYKLQDPQKDGRDNGKIYLIDKWIGMAKVADPNSRVYVLQAGDVYSPEKFLRAHHENFKNPNCLISMYPRGIFYHLKLEKAIFYDANFIDGCALGCEHFTSMHLYMALRTKDVAAVNSIDRNRRIDKHLKQSIFTMHNINPVTTKVIFSAEEIFPNDWKTGFNTDGLNTISSRKSKYLELGKVWKPHNKVCLKKYGMARGFHKSFPPDVLKFIKSKKEQINKRNR